jgi:hypothetical protein
MLWLFVDKVTLLDLLYTKNIIIVFYCLRLVLLMAMPGTLPTTKKGQHL